MKFLKFLILFFIAYVLYFLILPSSYFTLSYVKSLWYKNVHTSYRADLGQRRNDLPSFKLDMYSFRNTLFYYNKNGEVANFKIFDSSTLATVSKENYIIYQKVGDSISLYNKNGIKQWSLDTFSYPMLSFSGNLIALLSTDNTEISLYDQYRRKIMAKRFLGTMILDFSFCPFNDSFIVGTVEGNVYAIDNDGRDLFFDKIKGSKFNLVKSVSVSDSGKYYAAVVGMYPEKIILYNEKGKILWSKKTGFNRQYRVSTFIDEENQLFMEQGVGSIIVRDLSSGEPVYEINLAGFDCGAIKYFKADSKDDFILCLINGKLGNLAILFDRQGHIIWNKNIIDQYVVDCELINEQDRISFMLQCSDFIYTYAYIK